MVTLAKGEIPVGLDLGSHEYGISEDVVRDYAEALDDHKRADDAAEDGRREARHQSVAHEVVGESVDELSHRGFNGGGARGAARRG